MSSGDKQIYRQILASFQAHCQAAESAAESVRILNAELNYDSLNFDEKEMIDAINHHFDQCEPEHCKYHQGN